MQKSLISIIIPVFNTEKYISQCLDSVLVQQGVDLEIICVDDFSEDSSKEIIRSYMQKHKNIKLICLPKNQGAASARNMGLNHSKGAFIRFVDSDDLLPLGTLEKEFNQIIKDNSAFTFGLNQSFNYNNQWVPKFFNEIDFKKNRVVNLKDEPSMLNVGSVCNKLYLRNFLIEHGIKFIEYQVREDNAFSVCSYIYANKISIIPSIVYLYRSRNDSSSLTSRNDAKTIVSGINTLLSLKRTFEINNCASLFQTFLFHRVITLITFRLGKIVTTQNVLDIKKSLLAIYILVKEVDTTFFMKRIKNKRQLVNFFLIREKKFDLLIQIQKKTLFNKIMIQLLNIKFKCSFK